MARLTRVDPDEFGGTISPPRRFKITSSGILRFAVNRGNDLLLDDLEWIRGRPRNSFRFHRGHIVLDYGNRYLIINMKRREDHEKDMYISCMEKK